MRRFFKYWLRNTVKVFSSMNLYFRQVMTGIKAKTDLLNFNSNSIAQWFPNYSGTRTTWNNLVVREAQNIDLNRDSRTTLANLADHQWSSEQNLGITAHSLYASIYHVYYVVEILEFLSRTSHCFTTFLLHVTLLD